MRLRNFRDKSNGTTDVDIQYDEVFLESAKQHFKKKELAKGDMAVYIDAIIQKATNGIDGYKMEIEDEEKV